MQENNFVWFRDNSQMKMTNKKKQRNGKYRALGAVILLLLLCMLLFLYQIYRSYHNPVVRQVVVETEGKVSDPFRMVLIADVHGQKFGPDNEDLISLIIEEKTDFIVIAGDLIDRYSQDEAAMLHLVSILAKHAPVYFGPGNQEFAYMEKKDPDFLKKVAGAGAVVLDKEYEDINIRGQKIRIGGIYEYAFSSQGEGEENRNFIKDGVDLFKKDFEDTDACKIMVSHRPDAFIFGDASRIWDLDLVVSGHLHGGQVVLPFLGGLWAGDQGYFPDYCYGLHRKDQIQLLITAGLGSHKETLPRFNNPPEIMSVTIQ